MGAVLSVFKTILPYVILGAIAYYYATVPRRPRRVTSGVSTGTSPLADEPFLKKEKPTKTRRIVARSTEDTSTATPASSGTSHEPVDHIPGGLSDVPALADNLTKPHQRVFSAATVADSDTGAELSGKETASKKKRKPKKPSAPATSAPVTTPAPVVRAPPTDTLDDGPWTRVETRQKKPKQPAEAEGRRNSPSISSSGLTTEEDADTPQPPPSVPTTSDDDRKTLAEQLVRRAPPTRVDDMLEVPHDPSLARVMRIAPGPNDVPATGSWGDYDDVSTEDVGSDDGFTPVGKSRPRKQRVPRQPGEVSTSSAPTSDTQTKKQRQNAARRDAAKGAKAEAEAAREATLAKHRRDRINDLYQGSKSTPSGGQKAVVTEDFQLAWES